MLSGWKKKKKKVYDLSVRRKGFCCCMPVDQIWKMEGTLEILTLDQPQDLQWQWYKTALHAEFLMQVC